MGRKRKRGFEWVAEDAEGEAIEPVERPSRSAEKRRRKQIEDLVKRIARLSPGHRRALPFDEDVLDALDDLANSKPTPNRRRLLIRCKDLLAEHEPADIEQAIADAKAGILSRSED